MSDLQAYERRPSGATRRVQGAARRIGWLLWVALTLTLAPTAVLYVAIGSNVNGALTSSERERLLSVANFLETPGDWLWDGLRVAYPEFWNDHVRSEHFWMLVGRYFLGNLMAWLIALASVVGTIRVGLRLLRHRRAHL